MASRAAILELAWPASAVVVGWIWLKQGLTLTQALAAIVLTGTIYLIARDSTQANKVQQPKTTKKSKPLNKKATSYA